MMVEGLSRRRILVAEDDALLAETVVDALEGEGFQVTLATDGLEALEAAGSREFDALLTDIMMPRMDGMTLIRRVRAAMPRLPVVVMTGHAPANLETIVQRCDEGPLITLRKPMSLRLLIQSLSKILAPN
ncbi:MAG TPA: response regulator [Acetobacteraceae bacterium]|nr:response regulator [Acetobacteraceae bacterium]